MIGITACVRETGDRQEWLRIVQSSKFPKTDEDCGNDFYEYAYYSRNRTFGKCRRFAGDPFRNDAGSGNYQHLKVANGYATIHHQSLTVNDDSRTGNSNNYRRMEAVMERLQVIITSSHLWGVLHTLLHHVLHKHDHPPCPLS